MTVLAAPRPIAAVLDASVAAPWFLPDEASETADQVYALMRRGSLVFHAPELWAWECGNIIASAVKRRRLGPDDALLAWGAVDAVRACIAFGHPEPQHVPAALRLALAHGISVYDAAYLRLAKGLGLPLFTADRKLGRAASATGVATLGFEDFR